MWFKGDTEDPFYSLDMRVKGKQGKAVGKHWAHKLWRKKATFIYKEVIYGNISPIAPILIIVVIVATHPKHLL